MANTIRYTIGNLNDQQRLSKEFVGQRKEPLVNGSQWTTDESDWATWTYRKNAAKVARALNAKGLHVRIMKQWTSLAEEIKVAKKAP